MGDVPLFVPCRRNTLSSPTTAGGTRRMCPASCSCLKKVRAMGSSRPRSIKTLVSRASSLFAAPAIDDLQSFVAVLPHFCIREFVANLPGFARGAVAECVFGPVKCAWLGKPSRVLPDLFSLGPFQFGVLLHRANSG